jgi:hypothetical protein
MAFQNIASQLWERLPAAIIGAGSPSHRQLIKIPKQELSFVTYLNRRDAENNKRYYPVELVAVRN